MGFLSNFFNSGDQSLKSKFFPICGSGKLPYIKVIPKKRKVFCAETMTKSQTVPLDQVTKISFEKIGKEGGLVHIFSENTSLITIKSNISPDKKEMESCLEFIKTVQKK